MSLAWSTAVRFLTVTAVLVALAAAAVSASAQPPQPTSVPGEALFVISGRGWGHGVGMSQYGAYGMANAGRTYDQILAHYYTGTELGPAPTTDVRVLLVESAPATTIASTVPFTVLDRAGVVHKVPAGPLVLRPKLSLPSVDGPVRVPGPLVVRPGKKAPLSLDGHAYRGRLEITVKGSFLRVVNFVKLEDYLQGVIAGEMPHRWPLEALKAQAVAARSYALASLVKGKPFDLYSDVRSQVYRGVEGETARTSEAVRATSGEVVIYGGRVATTYYFSTSGGRTASAADVFGTPVPYLLSRPDPYDEASPHHRWGPELLGARTLQSKLALDGRVLDALGVPTASGRLRSLTVQTDQGPETVTAGLLRTSLGLRSTWITVGVLRLDQPRDTIRLQCAAASRRHRSSTPSADALLVPRRIELDRGRCAPARDEWPRVGGRQARANVAVPDRGRRRGLSCGARSGRSSNPARAGRGADDALGNGSAATLGSDGRDRAARGHDVEADRQVDRGSDRRVPGQAPLGAGRVPRTDSCDRRLRRRCHRRAGRCRVSP